MKIGGRKVDIVPISQANLKNQIKNVYPCPIDLTVCPICGGVLREYKLVIAISEKECAKADGLACYRCDAFFPTYKRLLDALERIRVKENSYELNRSFDVPFDTGYYSCIRKKLKSIYCQITLCAAEDIRVYTIVAKASETDMEKRIVRYSDPIALKLLTAITLKASMVELDGKQFAIEGIRNMLGPNGWLRIVDPSDTVVVSIRANGGYYSPDKDTILVDGLVFCENSNRLEVLSMSYNKLEQVYFVDRQNYTRFVKTHGWPIVKYASHYKEDWVELRDESLLHLLGYSVSEEIGLSDQERHALLGRMVDLGFISVHSIVTLLNSLIIRNGSQVKNAQARAKWQNDLEFITKYKADPERFVFVSKIRNL